MGKVNSPSPDIRLGGVVHAASKALKAVAPSKAKQPVKH